MQIHLLHSEVESSYSRTPCKEDRSLLYLCNSGVNVEFMRPKVWIAGPIQLLDPPRLVWSWISVESEILPQFRCGTPAVMAMACVQLL